MNDETDTMDAGAFAQSLTLAEIAIYENTAGHSIGEEDSSAELFAGMTVIAARRLGSKITIKEAQSLTLEQAQTMYAAAASAGPLNAKPSKEMLKLMETLATLPSPAPLADPE